MRPRASKGLDATWGCHEYQYDGRLETQRSIAGALGSPGANGTRIDARHIGTVPAVMSRDDGKSDDQPRIVNAEVRYVALPTGMRSFVLPNGHRTPTDLSVLLVRVTDVEGAIGHSLLWAQRDRHLPVLEASLRYVAEAVLGQPAGPASLVGAMRQSAAFLGTDGVTAFGISGIEMAIQDLRCRRAEMSLSDMIGRRREQVRLYQTGLMLSATIDELIEEAAAIYSSGIKAMKMIVGKPTIDEDVERVQAVTESLPADASLMVDALQRWELADAMKACERLADVDLVWIEDPISQSDVRGLRELVSGSPTPIATGEVCFSLAHFEALLDAGVPYVVAELERVGGISGWLATAELVRDRSAVMLPHLYPHVSAQLMATLPDDDGWCEYVPWFNQIVSTSFELDNGMLKVARDPGSGFDPSPDAVERLSRTPWLPLTP